MLYAVIRFFFRYLLVKKLVKFISFIHTNLKLINKKIFVLYLCMLKIIMYFVCYNRYHNTGINKIKKKM